MPVSDAFRNRFATRIENQEVPRIHEKVYTSFREQARDIRTLENWLRQRGFTDAEIATKSYNAWSLEKTNFYDLGKMPFIHNLKVPIESDDLGWKTLLEQYGFDTPDARMEVRASLWKFQEESYLASQDIVSTVRATEETGTSQIVDRFLRQYSDNMQMRAEYTDISSDLSVLRRESLGAASDQRAGILEALDTIDSYSHDVHSELFSDPVESVLEPRPTEWLDRVFEPRPPRQGIDGINDYIATEEARLAAPEPLLPEFDPYLDTLNTVPSLDVDGPEAFRQYVRGVEFLGEEDLRIIAWENPDMTQHEMLRELQDIPVGETVEAYSQRVYSMPADEAFGHVFAIWEQEAELGQAMRVVQNAFPDNNLTAQNLRERMFNMRTNAPGIEDHTIADFFDRTLPEVDAGVPEIPRFSDEDGKLPILESEITNAGPEEFRHGLEPEEFRRTQISTSIGELSVLGLDPTDYALNREAINARVQAAINDNSIMSRITRTPSGELFVNMGGLILGAVGGVALGELLHNSTQMFAVGLGTALTMDPFAAPMSIMPLYGSALLDWQRRGIKGTHAMGGEQSGTIMFVRGPKNNWLPAIVRGDAEPTQWNNPVDVGDFTEKWDGIHRLTYETGYGLTAKDGKLVWMVPGITSQLFARQYDMTGGNQETWKPWLQYWMPKADEQETYKKTGLLKSIDAVPYEKIYEDLGASDAFKSMVELIHYAHLNQQTMFQFSKSTAQHWSGVTDPYFKTHWNPDRYRKEPDHPDTFQGGYQWTGFQDADVASLLAWNFENANPDNFWQRQSKWRKASDSRDYVTKITKYFVGDIETQYARLSDATKEELRREGVEFIPQTAVELSKRMLEIEQNKLLSEDARQFRLAQEQARFFTRHSFRIDATNNFQAEFTDMLGWKLLGEYKQATYDFADLHPQEFVSQEFNSKNERTYNIMFGKTAHTFTTQNNNALGFFKIPPIRKMPTISRTSRAFVEAHNLSLPPVIGGPVKAPPPDKVDPEPKGSTGTFGGLHGTLGGLGDPLLATLDPMHDEFTNPGKGFVWDGEFSHSWVKQDGGGPVVPAQNAAGTIQIHPDTIHPVTTPVIASSWERPAATTTPAFDPGAWTASTAAEIKTV
jgi:hypothetical protein